MNKNDILVGAGAAGSVILPGVAVNALPAAVTSTLPGFFGSALPTLAATVPACTGVCGACGGGCFGSVALLGYLALCATCKSTIQKT